MPHDIFIKLNRCYYCGKPGFIFWDVDLHTCGREVCESLAFAEVRRRSRDGVDGPPEKHLARALLSALSTFEYELRLDVDAELIEPDEAKRLDEAEREKTAHLLSELHELERRYPAPRPKRQSGHRSATALA